MPNVLSPPQGRNHRSNATFNEAYSGTSEIKGLTYESLPGDPTGSEVQGQADFQQNNHEIPPSAEVHNHQFTIEIVENGAAVIRLRGGALAEGKLPTSSSYGPDTHNYHLPA